MKEKVVLKGDKDGLFLMVNPDLSFPDALSELEEKLKTSSEFFVKTPNPSLVRYKGEHKLNEEEKGQLCSLLDRYGLLYGEDIYSSDDGDFASAEPLAGGDMLAVITGEQPCLIDADDFADSSGQELAAGTASERAEEKQTAAADAHAAPVGEPDVSTGTVRQQIIVAAPEDATQEKTSLCASTGGNGTQAEKIRINPETDVVLSEENFDGKYPQEFVVSSDSSGTPSESVIKPALTVYRTVRGGQEISYDGTIIIFGNVNPTARVVATNDIFVAGVTRGILHAGCQGDEAAAVAAGSFDGGQVRIAGFIARAPDQPAVPTGFGVARIKDGQIEIQTIRR